MWTESSITALTTGSEEDETFSRIGTSRFDSLYLFKLSLCQLACFDGFGTVFVQILSRVAVVVETVYLLPRSGCKDSVCIEPIPVHYQQWL